MINECLLSFVQNIRYLEDEHQNEVKIKFIRNLIFSAFLFFIFSNRLSMTFLVLVLVSMDKTRALNIECRFFMTACVTCDTDPGYQCDVINLETYANTVVTSVSGQHVINRGNYDVQRLHINNQICESIPKDFEKFFPFFPICEHSELLHQD